ncbi:MAG: methyltransferase domain-containing protein [Azoarcus sp.]|nr:methyltransferase domain-containing protein [Azoarcus sp.]
MSWDPDRYLGFHDLRLRPAVDLLARVPLDAPACIVDLGCGPGNVARVLRERWPDAALIGVDQSAAMLARARDVLPDARWVEADIAQWRTEGRADLIFSNAALHWVDEHPALFARLAEMVTDDGVLAVQMPANFDAPSHRLIRELASATEWAERLSGARMGSVLAASVYHQLLAAHFEVVDLWETTYFQQLAGEDAVFEWLAGTTLVPYLDRLNAVEGAEFAAGLKPLLANAYPVGSDGSVLFPFKRMFMVANGRRHRVSRGT